LKHSDSFTLKRNYFGFWGNEINKTIHFYTI